MQVPSVFGRWVMTWPSFIPRAVNLRADDTLDGVENGGFKHVFPIGRIKIIFMKFHITLDHRKSVRINSKKALNRKIKIVFMVAIMKGLLYSFS